MTMEKPTGLGGNGFVKILILLDTVQVKYDVKINIVMLNKVLFYLNNNR